MKRKPEAALVERIEAELSMWLTAAENLPPTPAETRAALKELQKKSHEFWKLLVKTDDFTRQQIQVTLLDRSEPLTVLDPIKHLKESIADLIIVVRDTRTRLWSRKRTGGPVNATPLQIRGYFETGLREIFQRSPGKKLTPSQLDGCVYAVLDGLPPPYSAVSKNHP